MSAKQIIDAMWDDSPVDVSTEVNFIWSIANLSLIHISEPAWTVPQRQVQGCHHSYDDHPPL